MRRSHMFVSRFCTPNVVMCGRNIGSSSLLQRLIMFCHISLLLLALLKPRISTSSPVLSVAQAPTSTVAGAPNPVLTPRQTSNESRANLPTLSSNPPILYPFPSNPALTLRFSGEPGSPLYRDDARRAIFSLRGALLHWMTARTDSRDDPIHLRTIRSTRSVQAEIGRFPSIAEVADGPRDGKSRVGERLMTFEEGVQVMGAMYAMMTEYGFVGRRGEVVQLADGDVEGAGNGGGNGSVIGFVNVTKRQVAIPGRRVSGG
ncbi:MAG: hypothetical protein Q9169_005614 [Polycauliona sp. 2 TL-2023]